LYVWLFVVCSPQPHTQEFAQWWRAGWDMRFAGAFGAALQSIFTRIRGHFFRLMKLQVFSVRQNDGTAENSANKEKFDRQVRCIFFVFLNYICCLNCIHTDVDFFYVYFYSMYELYSNIK
jgi:hypothetical protein